MTWQGTNELNDWKIDSKTMTALVSLTQKADLFSLTMKYTDRNLSSKRPTMSHKQQGGLGWFSMYKLSFQLVTTVIQQTKSQGLLMTGLWIPKKPPWPDPSNFGAPIRASYPMYIEVSPRLVEQNRSWAATSTEQQPQPKKGANSLFFSEAQPTCQRPMPISWNRKATLTIPDFRSGLKHGRPKQPFYILSPFVHCTHVGSHRYQLDVVSGCHWIDSSFPSAWQLSWEQANLLLSPLPEVLAKSTQLLSVLLLSHYHIAAPRKHHYSK